MPIGINRTGKGISGKDAIIRATEELKYYFDIQDKKVFLEKVEPTDNNGWIIMLSYLSDEPEKGSTYIDDMMRNNPLFATASKQYINIYLDMEGELLELNKANAPK